MFIKRDFADAIKAIEQRNPEAVVSSTAFQALAQIGAIYKLESPLQSLLVIRGTSEDEADFYRGCQI